MTRFLKCSRVQKAYRIPKNVTAATAPLTNFVGAILELLLRENDFVLQGFHIVQL